MVQRVSTHMVHNPNPRYLYSQVVFMIRNHGSMMGQRGIAFPVKSTDYQIVSEHHTLVTRGSFPSRGSNIEGLSTFTSFLFGITTMHHPIFRDRSHARKIKHTLQVSMVPPNTRNHVSPFSYRSPISEESPLILGARTIKHTYSPLSFLLLSLNSYTCQNILSQIPTHAF